MRRSTLALAGAALALSTPAGAQTASADFFPNSGAKAQEGVLYGAVNLGGGGSYLIVGAVHAPGGINQTGFLLNVSGELLSYDYTSLGTTFDADGWGLSGMAGYQFVFSQGSKVAGYVGVAHRDIDTNPNDPVSETAHGNTAFKAQIEGYHGFNHRYDVSALANYFNSVDTYYARVRGGIKVGDVVVGPEIAVHGSDEYDSQEYGGFVRYVAGDMLTLGARVGYADRDNRGDDGGYAGIEVGLGY